MKRFWKILLRTVIILVLLLITVWLLIQTKPVQNWLVRQATQRLSKELNTKVEIKEVQFSLFNSMLLKGVLVEDHRKDTLLYAGIAKVTITDWFFFKDKAVLHYVGLQDASIQLQRADSVWNYQFLVDYFSGPGSSKKTKKGIEWELENVALKNIQVRQLDHWRGEDLTGKIGSLELDARKIDLTNKKIQLNTIDLKDPFFFIYNYDGNRPPKPKAASNNADPIALPDTLLRWNAAGWEIQVNDISIKNGTFKSDRQTERSPLDYFDGKHISFENINASFKNLQWLKDTISALANISTNERSGLIVKKLSAGIKFHPEAMEFHSLDLLTNKSHLRNYFAMRYKHFNDDMADFIKKVTMDGHFSNSTISSDDIAFFAPDLKSWKKEISITGNIKGAVDDLAGKNVIAQAGKNTLLNGDFKLVGLPNINETFIDFKANDFKTTYTDAVTFIPSLKKITQPRIDKLQYLNFKGSFTGFIHDFVTFGTLQTNLGTVYSDLNMKLPGGKAPAYSGNIKTDNFLLGQFLDIADVGKVSGDVKIKGSGFNPDKLYAELTGHLNQIELRNYNYQNITAACTIDKKQFEGNVKIADPNIEAVLDGKIKLNQKIPSFIFDAVVNKLNLKELGLTKQNLRFAGNISTNFTGSTIDNFLGEAHIFNAELFHKDDRLPIDSLSVYSTMVNNKKSMVVRSNEADISLDGDYNIADLPVTFQVFLNKYYPSYINIPGHIHQNENFQFHIKTGNISPFLNLFDEYIKGLDNTTINGNLNLAQNQLNIEVNVPSFSYKNTVFTDIALSGKGDLQKLNLTGTVGDVAINDSLHLPNSEISIKSANNISEVSIKTSASKAVNAAELSARVETRKDGFKINFNPSSLVFNDKRWTIEKNGELILSKTKLDASQVKLSSGEQEIIISTEPSSIGSSNDVVVSLKKVTVDDFLPLFLKQPQIEGRISGDIRITDPFNNLQVDGNPVIEQARFEDDSLGLLKTEISYSKKTGDIIFKVFSDNEEYRFTVDGLFQTKDSVRNNMNINFNLNNSAIHWLEKYLGTLFGNIKGKATGNVKLVGNSASPDLIGKAVIKEGAFKILYTQCTYKFDEAS
ncbi:MAG: translocation/assembly module TamB domain-containing protein, partial [Sphingobacteriales bacterium]|nr:translocation/assembly module TamB domain-containing protein [Sphingobacteriales bacterium]